MDVYTTIFKSFGLTMNCYVMVTKETMSCTNSGMNRLIETNTRRRRIITKIKIGSLGAPGRTVGISNYSVGRHIILLAILAVTGETTDRFQWPKGITIFLKACLLPSIYKDSVSRYLETRA